MSNSLKIFSLKSLLPLIFQLIKNALCLNPLLNAQQNKTAFNIEVGSCFAIEWLGLPLMVY